MRGKPSRSLFRRLLEQSSLLPLPRSPAVFHSHDRLGCHGCRPLRKRHQVWLSYPFSTCYDSKPRPIPSPNAANSVRSGSGEVELGPISHIGIGKSVLSRCSFLWAKKADAFVEESSLQDILKVYGDLAPESTRRFWRASELRPADFLEILLGFGDGDLSLRKVDFLSNLFRWAERQTPDFNHLPRSYEAMVYVLTGAHKYEDAESLLLEAESNGIWFNSAPLFSSIIQGYAEHGKSEKSLALFDKARERGIIPSPSTYQALLSLFTKHKKIELATKVYWDMVEVGLASYSEDCILNIIVDGLINSNKILEAITLLRKLRSLGITMSNFALSSVALGLCKKKDFEDMITFLDEWRHVPEICVCNKIISSLCLGLGAQQSWSFMQRMEHFGFKPDSTTFSILAYHSCRNGKLKDGFVYLSECLSRGLAPNTYIYNALISGIFKKGLHRHAKDIFEDMLERGIMPNHMTFRYLLAGYCKFRKFDKVKEVLSDMKNRCLISLDPLDDTLSKALMFLGLDHLNVKVKRDNNVGISRSEFFDCLGNGLYLDTDIEDYETSLERILDDSVISDFDYCLMRKNDNVDLQIALRVKDELIQWGQNLSYSTYANLLRCLAANQDQLKQAVGLLHDMPDLFEQLDGETLNLLLQMLSKNGMVDTAMFILRRMYNIDVMVESQSFMMLIVGLCKDRDIGGLKECCNLIQKCLWSPESMSIEPLFNSLCKWGLIEEVLQLFDRVIENHPEMVSFLSIRLLKELCMTGYTSVGCMLMEELFQRNTLMDATAYQYLGMGFLKEKHLSESIGMLDILHSKNMALSINVYQNFVQVLLKFDRIEEAFALKQSLLTKKPDSAIITYSILLSELCRTKKLNVASSQLQEMLLGGIFPYDTAFNALLRMYCLANNLREARGILGIMVRVHGNLSILGYRSLVKQMLLNGLVYCAMRLKDLILHKDTSLQLCLYNILIFYLFQTGKSLLLKQLLSEMDDKDICPDKNTYDFLVHGFHKCGEGQLSVEALNTMISKGWRPSNRSMRIVVCYLCKDGKLGKALELSKVMEHNKWKHGSVVQNALAGSLLRCGSLSEAELILDRLDKKGLIPMKIDYNSLVRHFCLHGRIKKAVELLNLMLKKGNIPSDTSYNSIILRFCHCKTFDQALDFFVEMLHKNILPSEESRYALVNGLCENGRTDDARNILRSMLQFSLPPTFNMYNCVLNSFRLSDNLDKASELLNEMQLAGHSPNFETHWSIIRNLDIESDDDNAKNILAGILSGNRLPVKNSKRKGA
ncbi:LOW QUALITY PROTEIN: pentatricopeptide repeat-containing protein At5g15280, mitochondrial [Curcuma longa]|uniref:LOW QUALITY PROTEIN: pentatricopeptide repeat-containing protein At5g15280, mitochondrial n=1 Tax=Curcuma longa TaxID=136217 RepID=UPI003D9EDD86